MAVKKRIKAVNPQEKIMKKTLIFFVSLAVILSGGCSSKDNIILHEKWPFPAGTAVPGARTNNGNLNSRIADALNSGSPQHRLLKHFNVVAAENEMKPYALMPEDIPLSGSWSAGYNWTDSDRLVNYAQANGKRVRGHVLIWHDQTPAWFFKGSGVSGRAAVDELYFRMENHIKTVFEKYGGKIEWWDVCNEVVDHTSGGPRQDSNYTRIMQDAGKRGMDRYEYVIKAFEWARKYADLNGGQNVKLYLTDYGIERRFPGESRSKIDDFEDLVKYLVDNNAPIDGIGFQGHFRLYDHTPQEIGLGIDRFSEINGKKLMIQVCELDISVYSNAKNEANELNLSDDILKERLKDLASFYREYFDMFAEKYREGKLDMVILWGIADGHSWLNNHPVAGRTDYPLLFDRKHQPKEAYWALVN